MSFHGPLRLPLELVRDVFEYLADDRASLITLATLCRVFADEAQRILYRFMPAGKADYDHYLFLQTITRKPHLAKHLQRYERGTGGDYALRNKEGRIFGLDRKVAKLFQEALPSMVRLEKIISSPTSPSPRRPWFPAKHMDSVQLTAFEWFSPGTPPDVEESVYHFLCSQKSMHRLAWFPKQVWEFPTSALRKVEKLTTNGNGLVSVLPRRRVKEIFLTQVPQTSDLSGGPQVPTNRTAGIYDEVDPELWASFLKTAEKELAAVKKFTFGDYERKEPLGTILPRISSLDTLVMTNMFDWEIKTIIRKSRHIRRLGFHLDQRHAPSRSKDANASMLDMNDLVYLTGEWFKDMLDLQEVFVENSNCPGRPPISRLFHRGEVMQKLRKAKSFERRMPSTEKKM